MPRNPDVECFPHGGIPPTEIKHLSTGLYISAPTLDNPCRAITSALSRLWLVDGWPIGGYDVINLYISLEYFKMFDFIGWNFVKKGGSLIRNFI